MASIPVSIWNKYYLILEFHQSLAVIKLFSTCIDNSAFLIGWLVGVSSC